MRVLWKVVQILELFVFCWKVFVIAEMTSCLLDRLERFSSAAASVENLR